MTDRQMVRMRTLELEYDAICKRRKEIYEELDALQRMYRAEKGFVTSPAAARGTINAIKRNRPVLQPLGSILRDARIARNLNQSAIAEMFGVTTCTISHYETGRLIPPKEKYIIHFPELKGAKEWKLIEIVRGRH